MSHFKADAHFVDEDEVEEFMAMSSDSDASEVQYVTSQRIHVYDWKDGEWALVNTGERVGSIAEYTYFRMINEHGKHFFLSEKDYRRWTNSN